METNLKQRQRSMIILWFAMIMTIGMQFPRLEQLQAASYKNINRNSF